MLDFTQCDWIDLTKLTRYHQNLISFLSDTYLNKSGGTMNGQINSCSILPKSPSSYNLGSSTNQWSNIYSNGFVLVDSIGQIRPNSTGTGNLGSSNYYWGNAYINNISSGNIVPKTDNTYNLGSSSYKFKDAYINNITTDYISSGDIVPKRNKLYELGSSISYWLTAYIDDIRANTITSGDIVPKTDNRCQLGNYDNRWNYAYITDITSIYIEPKDNGMGQLGNSNSYWGNAYINNIYGKTIYQNGSQVALKSEAESAQTTANTALTSATSANNKIDNLQVGGRNLLLDSAKGWENSVYPTCIINFGNEKPISGNTLTVSFKATIDWTKISRITAYFDSNTSVTNLYETNIDANGNYIKTFTLSSTINNPTFRLYTFLKSGVSTRPVTKIDWVKLEYGNQATTWTPAPEDVDANISTAQTTANNAVTNLNNINLMTAASVDALFNLTSATNALESVQIMDSDDITDVLHDR